MIAWLLSVLITLGASYYQKTTGPAYPVDLDVALAGEEIRLTLERTHGGEGDQEVAVESAPAGVTGTILWRRYPLSEEFRPIVMEREGERLVGRLPHQPPAGKLEYHLELESGGERIVAPADRNVVTRFRGGVPAVVLVPHILFIFSAMLLSNRTGIEAIRNGPRLMKLTLWTMALLFLGGLVFGPIVQKYAFGAYWTGIPFGHDLTDNKTLIAFVGWIIALVRLRRGVAGARWWVLGAALLTVAIFLIPHSAHGSELKYE